MSDGLYLVDPAKDAQHVANCLAQGGFNVRPASMPVRTASDRAAMALAVPASVSPPAPAAAVLRKVQPISIAGLVPAKPDTAPPRIEWVDPTTLLINEAYQRNLSEKSLRLIRKIVTGWSWRKFTPPLCADGQNGRELLDGQHTSIGAASHPDIEKIPVLVVDAATVAQRAQAFASLNSDRLGITAMQLHYASVAGGVPAAIEIDQAARAAGVTILRVTPAGGAYKPRETIAVAEIGKLIAKRGGMTATGVLAVLADAGLGPINAGMIKAVDLLLHDPEYSDQVSPAGLTRGLLAIKATWAGEAAVFAATHRVPVWKALAVVLFRKAKERRRAGGAE